MFVITQCLSHFLITITYSAVETALKLYEADNGELSTISELLKVNRLSLNVKETQYMVFTNVKHTIPNIGLNVERKSISTVKKTT